jgi:hypothetical protein
LTTTRRSLSLAGALISTLIAAPAGAADQTQPGAGNAKAVAIAAASPLVSSGRRLLHRNAQHIRSAALRSATLDAIENPSTCVAHRADLSPAEPAVDIAELLLRTLAPEFGYDPASVGDYNNHYRNPALSYLSAERILMLYGNNGLPAVRAELRRLHVRGVL